MATSCSIIETLMISYSYIPKLKRLHIYKHFQIILTLVSHTSIGIVQHLSSLSQPVTSHADDNGPLKEVLIVYISQNHCLNSRF